MPTVEACSGSRCWIASSIARCASRFNSKVPLPPFQAGLAILTRPRSSLNLATQTVLPVGVIRFFGRQLLASSFRSTRRDVGVSSGQSRRRVNARHLLVRFAADGRSMRALQAIDQRHKLLRDSSRLLDRLVRGIGIDRSPPSMASDLCDADEPGDAADRP